MRNRLITTALVLAAAGSTQAVAAQQQAPRAQHEQHQEHARGQRRAGPMQRFFRGIELTDAQRQRVHAIFAEGRPNRAEGRTQRGARPAQRS